MTMQNKITPARSDYECYWTYGRLIEKTIDSFDHKELLRKEIVMLMGYNGLYDAFGQACDRVKELEEENGRLKEEIEELRLKYGWKDYPENEPPYESTEQWEMYLCELDRHGNNGVIAPLYFIGGRWYPHHSAQHVDYTNYVIRFQELPQPPESET